MNRDLHQLLHARGMTQTKLAALAGVGRCHLSQVLANKRGGQHTRRRVLPHLCFAEVLLLGWEADWLKWWTDRADDLNGRSYTQGCGVL